MDAYTLFKRCIWLEQVPEVTLRAWASRCHWQRCLPQECVFTPDSPLEWVYLLGNGCVRLESAHTTAAATEVCEMGSLLDPVAVFMAPSYEHTGRCLAPTEVLCLPIALWRGLATEHPDLWQSAQDRLRDWMLSESLRRALHRALPHSDIPALLRLAFEDGRWWHMARGEPLFHADDPFEAWYVLVSGQLAEFDSQVSSAERAYTGDALTGAFSHPKMVLQPGDLVGDTSALMGGSYTSTVFALRDAWLMRFEPHEFDSLVLQQPETVQQVARHALQRRQQPRHQAQAPNTLTVFADAAVPDAAALVLALYQGIAHFQPVVLLNAQLCESWGIVPELAQRQRADLEWLRLDAWVQHEHEKGKLVLLVADAEDTIWGAQAARLADRVLLLADAQAGGCRPPAELWPLPSPSATSATAPPTAWALQRWLCLVHPTQTAHPTGTQRWLTALQPDKHFHLRVGHAQDLGRLVRHLTHQTIGLVLSGGGGRGPTHAGVFRALEQAQIPIDCVVGASAGALMGCLLAQDRGWRHCAEQAIRGIGPPPGPFGDLTLPIVSIVKSQRLYDSVRRTFPSEHLEDTWIPCFVVATNLSRMNKTVFQQGEVWEAALASVSPPGVAKPRIINGELLCDGGLIENLPVGVLVEQGCRYIIASNIATQLNLSLNVPDFPSPWAIAFDRLWRGGRATAAIPSAIDILLAATTLASADNCEALSHLVDMALTPNLKRFKSTDFTQSQVLVTQGFTDASAQIALHQRGGRCPELWSVVHKSRSLSWSRVSAAAISPRSSSSASSSSSSRPSSPS